MDYEQLIESFTPELYQRFVAALELGRWPDGQTVTPEQREHCMQAVIAYGEKNLPETERIGFIDRGHKAGSQCDDDTPDTLHWKN